MSCGVDTKKQCLCMLVVCCLTAVMFVTEMFLPEAKQNTHGIDPRLQYKSTHGSVNIYPMSSPLPLLSGLLRTNTDETNASRTLTMTSLQQVLHYEKITKVIDFRDLANISNSKIHILGNDTRKGDKIRVLIHLYDGWNRRLLTGGDKLRIWLKEPIAGNSVTGYVVDHGNGTYHGIVSALWSGKSELKISIANTKEHIGIYLNQLKLYGTMHFINAIFVNLKRPKKRVMTFCSVIPRIFDSKDICNFTKENYNLSWFCGKPDHNFSCSDWTYYQASGHREGFSDKERLLVMYYIHMETKRSITIKNGTDLLTLNKSKCYEVKNDLTWQTTTPTGYYKNNRWENLICTLSLKRTRDAYIKCISGRRLLFYGDSTIRYWFVHLTKFLHLTFTTGRWDEIKDKAWQRYAHAESKRQNISLDWAPHALPFYGSANSSRKNIRSVAFRIDEVPANSRVIIVMNWFLHIARVTHSAFREHVRNAREAVVRLLKRSSHVKIFIKGPHAVKYFKQKVPYDFVRRIEEQILYEEFFELRDKVIYLDQWDATVANENVNVHPSEEVNLDMVHTMLSYICN